MPLIVLAGRKQLGRPRPGCAGVGRAGEQNVTGFRARLSAPESGDHIGASASGETDFKTRKLRVGMNVYAGRIVLLFRETQPRSSGQRRTKTKQTKLATGIFHSACFGLLFISSSTLNRARIIFE